MDWLQMEHGVLDKYTWSSCFHSQDNHQAEWEWAYPDQSIVLRGYPVRIDRVIFSVRQTQKDIYIFLSFLYEHLEAQATVYGDYRVGPSYHDRQERVLLQIGITQPAGCLQGQVD